MEHLLQEQLLDPVVSVVIPTRGRGITALRAVHSALNQTFTRLEVIVVVDGLDPITVELLGEVKDSRLTIIALDESVGGSEARNTGARAARGNWVAFLDDDDEWLSGKVEAQLSAAAHLQGPFIFIASRYFERSKLTERVLPTRSLESHLPFSEFLFCRTSLRGGTGYVQTSTWFVSKQLIDAVPFTKGLRRNQDVDWMLHAMAKPGCQFLILQEPLTIFYDHNEPGRVSKRPDWKFQYDWAMANRSFMSAKAFSFCVATLCMPDAVRQRESITVFLKLLIASFTKGRVTLLCLAFFFYNWFVSEDLRTMIRSVGTRNLKLSSSL